MKINQRISIFIFLIIFLLTLSGNNIFTPRVFAQNTDSTPNTVPRTVLVELFVQGSCLTCPTAEFCLEDLAYEYGTSKFILVQEHLWGDGYDTAETNARYNWYVGDSKRGTPDVFIDGLTKRLQGLSCDCVEGNYECYKDAIDEELTRPSFLEISASKTPHPNSLPNIIIEGTVKNVSDTPLKDLAVCGMVGKERDKPGLYNYIQEIFPFKNIPLLLPGATFSFKFIPEISLSQENEAAKDKENNNEDEEETLHLVIFVQNLETKEVLQALYVE
ncbi:MAG TPA: hypothetical protein DCK79_01800 [Candidatus Atribacteria bacterium]|jgi:hypothetical protein|nr:hypothetical protein [Candidatus Atribacteria bacterium]